MNIVADDYMLTARQALFAAAALVLGLTDAQADAALRFVPAVEPGSVSMPAEGEGLQCFISFTPVPMPGEGVLRRAYTQNQADTWVVREEVQRGLEAVFCFRGPQAMTHAHQVYSGLHLPPADAVLRHAGMAALPNGPQPAWHTYTRNGNWHAQAEVRMRFYIVYTVEKPQEAAEDCTVITVFAQGGPANALN